MVVELGSRDVFSRREEQEVVTGSATCTYIVADVWCRS